MTVDTLAQLRRDEVTSNGHYAENIPVQSHKQLEDQDYLSLWKKKIIFNDKLIAENLLFMAMNPKPSVFSHIYFTAKFLKLL
jgi:hypothetical protein